MPKNRLFWHRLLNYYHNPHLKTFCFCVTLDVQNLLSANSSELQLVQRALNEAVGLHGEGTARIAKTAEAEEVKLKKIESHKFDVCGILNLNHSIEFNPNVVKNKVCCVSSAFGEKMTARLSVLQKVLKLLNSKLDDYCRKKKKVFGWCSGTCQTRSCRSRSDLPP